MCRRGGPEPLLTLAGYRRSRVPGGGGGKICFGVLFNQDPPPGGWGVEEESAPGAEGRGVRAEVREVAGGKQAAWVAARFGQHVAVGMVVRPE